MSSRTERLTESIFLFLVFLLVNLRSFVFWTLFPDTSSLTDYAWREIALWFLTLLLMAYLLWKRESFGIYLDVWRRQPLLIGFILLCLVSVAWSDSWTTTLHRSLVFLFASLAAAYIGTRHSLVEFIRILFWACAFFTLSSFLLIIIRPILGTDLNPPYNGAWRGIFWHKNHLGNLMPFFSLVFLFQIFQWKNPISRESVLALPLYLLSLLMLFRSSSAAGYIVALALHFALIVIIFWLKFLGRLRAIHYYGILVFVLFTAIAVVLKLDFVFGLFNRSSTLTGRVPLWGYLLKDIFVQKAWLGYGFGTIWSNLAFRIHTRDALGWIYPVMIGDNGFLDILLNLGILGLLWFLAVYVQIWARSLRYMILKRDLLSSFVFLFMLYTLFANISYSLFMETEVFIWSVMIILLFICSQAGNPIPEK